MKCPKCTIKLEVMEQEGHIGFCCTACFGALLTEPYVLSLNFQAHNSAKKFYAQLQSNLTETSKCTCPSCKNKMQTSIYRNVELDFCSSCKSVWFDFNELSTSLTSHKSGKTGSTYTKSDITSGILEFICEALSNIH